MGCLERKKREKTFLFLSWRNILDQIEIPEKVKRVFTNIGIACYTIC